jgi:hypothetical protein
LRLLSSQVIKEYVSTFTAMMVATQDSFTSIVELFTEIQDKIMGGK